MRVEFLYEPDCDSRDVSLARLREVLAEEGQPDAIEIIRVDTEDAAATQRFTGSPTIRIDGKDIDPPDPTARYMLSCRAYRLPDGRITPFPPKELIRAALRGAMTTQGGTP
jgi:hypothetical protein